MSAPIAGDSRLGVRSARGFGSELRNLRVAKGLTLRDLAKASGRSLGYLSQIERDLVRPSLATVEALAGALGVDTAWFFPVEAGVDDRERGVVARSQTRRRLSKTYSFDTEALGYEDFLLSPDLGLDLCMGLSRILPGGKTKDAPFSGRGHICGYVASGTVTLEVDGEVFVLFEADSFSLDMARAHNLRNESDAIAEIVWSIAPARLDF